MARIFFYFRAGDNKWIDNFEKKNYFWDIEI